MPPTVPGTLVRGRPWSGLTNRARIGRRSTLVGRSQCQHSTAILYAGREQAADRMSDPPDEALMGKVHDLKRKANQQATAHAWLRDRFSLAHSALSTISLVAGVFLLALIMASPALVNQTLGLSAGQYTWLTALAAAGSFSIIVVNLAWRLDVKATLHDQAVRHYTKSAYHAAMLLKCPDVDMNSAVSRLQTEYLDDRDLPRIPESRFLPLKKWHLEKVAISMELDKNPHESLSSIVRRLKEPRVATSAPIQVAVESTDKTVDDQRPERG